MRRLEAATARLEDIAMTQAPSGGPQFVSGASAVHPATPSAAAVPGGAGAAAVAAGSAEEAPASVQAFDELLQGPLAKYLALSKELGGLVAEQVRRRAHDHRTRLQFQLTRTPLYSPNKSQTASKLNVTSSSSLRLAPSFLPLLRPTKVSSTPPSRL